MMKTLKSTRSIPKAQQEVLDWKQTLYEEIKDMSTADGLNYLLEKGRKTVFRHKKPSYSF
ncbi:hypothetical protein QUF54_05590 [Candidatus Marithioploca araucensis]|uniref:Uncharacterized protein n=1 Tax=Candidatus Marithioploca araucensis TaxID=70273 RepID=A0ABT7VTD2_9GAMM|nr:hypothetical protein [Candidatus Marithioploca araucensis]